MARKAVNFPPEFKDIFSKLCDMAGKIGWVVWIPKRSEEGAIDGFVCGNETFLKKVGVALKANEPLTPPVDTNEQSH